MARLNFIPAVLAVIIAILGMVVADNTCNPLSSTTACPPTPGLMTKSYFMDFTEQTITPPDWILADYAKVDYASPNGANFTFAKRYDAPYIWSRFYVLFGRIDVVMKVAPGAGIITGAVMMSDDLDEIDWEWSGNNFASTPQVQTNYFGKGQAGWYDRSTTPAVSDPQDTYHTYSLDWQPDRLNWIIDGKIVRTLTNNGATTGSYQYPQTPSRLHLGLWCAGDPETSPYTISWGGGLTNFTAAPFSAYVKSVSISTNNTCSSWQYPYPFDGSYKSVQCSNQTMALPCTYTVVAGDNGLKIAKNLTVNFDSLQAANPGIDWDKLLLGQVLMVPGGSCPPSQNTSSTSSATSTASTTSSVSTTSTTAMLSSTSTTSSTSNSSTSLLVSSTSLSSSPSRPGSTSTSSDKSTSTSSQLTSGTTSISTPVISSSTTPSMTTTSAYPGSSSNSTSAWYFTSNSTFTSLSTTTTGPGTSATRSLSSSLQSTTMNTTISALSTTTPTSNTTTSSGSSTIATPSTGVSTSAMNTSTTTDASSTNTPTTVSTISILSSNSAGSTTTSSAPAQSYTVVAGDFGWAIADKNGCTFDALNAANPGMDWDHLQIGQTVNIPVQISSSSTPSTSSTAISSTSSATTAVTTASSSYVSITAFTITSTLIIGSTTSTPLSSTTTITSSSGATIPTSSTNSSSVSSSSLSSTSTNSTSVTPSTSSTSSTDSGVSSSIAAVSSSTTTSSSTTGVSSTSSADSSPTTAMSSSVSITSSSSSLSSTTSTASSGSAGTSTPTPSSSAPTSTSSAASSTTSSPAATSGSGSSSSSNVVTPVTTSVKMFCNQDNCLRNMIDPRYAASMRVFCSSYTTTTSHTMPLPTYLNGCSANASRVSSACSCLITSFGTGTATASGSASTVSAFRSGAPSGRQVPSWLLKRPPLRWNRPAV